jgi:cell division protein ZapA
MEEKLSIRVNVADRFYPLKIDRKDEEKIRRAAKQINDKVLQYKKKYIDKDIQDFLAMAALQFVTRIIDLEENHQPGDVITEVDVLNRELDDYFKKE